MDIYSSKDKYIKAKTLKDSGYSHYRINKLVEQNVLRKINNSTYENLLYKKFSHPPSFLTGGTFKEKQLIYRVACDQQTFLRSI